MVPTRGEAEAENISKVSLNSLIRVRWPNAGYRYQVSRHKDNDVDSSKYLDSYEERSNRPGIVGE